jgi:ppGpp synthetase/RelA/SpoT-type nucleotidyltranferase
VGVLAAIISIALPAQTTTSIVAPCNSQRYWIAGIPKMATKISKTQIDLLGNRIKTGDLSEFDLRLLDEYRRSYASAYETVVSRIRNEFGLEPTGRPAKSTPAIVDKLRRESIRLTQIQDIAGCRLTVADIEEQERVVALLTGLFPDSHVMDRRKQPSHGYRAVHVVATCCDKFVEIQVRTSLQHLWAELSEKLSDLVDASIKYGGGNSDTRGNLEKLSGMIDNIETLEKVLMDALLEFPSKQPELERIKTNIDVLHRTMHSQIAAISFMLEYMVLPTSDKRPK